MSETPQPTPSSQAPAELHWGIIYLREDIQDLKQDIRALHARIDETNMHQGTHFRWLMTTMIALAGIIIAVLKI